MTARQGLHPQIRVEWHETQWSPETRSRFASIMLRLMASDEDDDEGLDSLSHTW